MNVSWDRDHYTTTQDDDEGLQLEHTGTNDQTDDRANVFDTYLWMFVLFILFILFSRSLEISNVPT